MACPEAKLHFSGVLMGPWNQCSTIRSPYSRRKPFVRLHFDPTMKISGSAGARFPCSCALRKRSLDGGQAPMSYPRLPEIGQHRLSTAIFFSSNPAGIAGSAGNRPLEASVSLPPTWQRPLTQLTRGDPESSHFWKRV